MKAIVCDRYGSPDVLRLEEVTPPRVERDDDVLVKVAATSPEVEVGLGVWLDIGVSF